MQEGAVFLFDNGGNFGHFFKPSCRAGNDFGSITQGGGDVLKRSFGSGKFNGYIAGFCTQKMDVSSILKINAMADLMTSFNSKPLQSFTHFPVPNKRYFH